MMLELRYRPRVYQQYRDMTRRCQPKWWKTGKKKGQVRIPGLASLPFFRDELWAHVMAQVPAGGALCPYCKAYGRETVIFLDTFVLDHHIALKRGGSWELRNLICVCKDCNNIKGSMSYEAFIVLMRDFLPEFDAPDRKYITSCLRTHGTVMRGWGKQKPPEQAASPVAVPVKQRTLDDEF